jgi:hypothetical protein
VCVARLAATVAALPAPSPAAPVDSRHVKAVFVVDVLSFVMWPAEKLGPPPARLVVAVIGDPEFAALVSEVAAARRTESHPVTVRAVPEVEAALDAHLIFIATSQTRRLPSILRTLAGTPVLTVGDTDGFAQDGVALNLYTFDNRVRIEINSTATARAGLRISANLMRLARVVE